MTKTFRRPGAAPVAALDGVDLAILPDQFVSVVGPSGCGKTTLLRLMNGLVRPDAGSVLVDGAAPRPGPGTGFVFQSFRLIPWATVAENVAFPLEVAGAEPALRRERVARYLDLVGLTRFAGAYPAALSGGMKQRVALARALAPQPRLLLLDEPFSNLDVSLRERLGQEVRDILKAAQATAILVTHDQHEAFAMADKVGVMEQGRIMQWDSPYNLYHQPANRMVADFIGQGVLLPGEVCADACIRIELGEACSLRPHGFAAGSRVEVLLRPDDVAHDDASPLRARVAARAFRGAEFLYTLALPSGQTVLSLAPSHHDHAIGEEIGVRLDAEHLVAFAI